MKPASARRIRRHPALAILDLPAKGKGAGLHAPTPTPWRRQCRRHPGAHAVLIVDQAGWHLTPKLAIPDNITVLALPPRSPELNPVENVEMRDNWLSNHLQILRDIAAGRGMSDVIA